MEVPPEIGRFKNGQISLFSMAFPFALCKGFLPQKFAMYSQNEQSLSIMLMGIKTCTCYC